MRTRNFIHGFQQFDALGEPGIALDGTGLNFTQPAEFVVQVTNLAFGLVGDHDGHDGHHQDQTADEEEDENNFVHNAAKCLRIGGQWKLIFPGGIIDKPYSLRVSA